MEKNGKKYDCRVCMYREKISGLCGFCMMKILDEVKKDGDKQTQPKSAE